MTTLDPSHLPSLSNDRHHGQAVHESVTALHPEAQAEHAAAQENSAGPSWRGAWARRQAAKQQQQQQATSDDSSDSEDEEDHSLRLRGKVPVPPIPDLRYEQGVLLSIRPFLHRDTLPSTPTVNAAAASEDAKHPHHDEKVEAGEKGALVGTALTAEGADKGLAVGEQSDIFSGPLRIEWGQVSYVLVRDQFVYPLLQGLLWGVGSLWLGSLWSWNKARLADKSGGRPRPSGPGLLSRLGIHFR